MIVFFASLLLKKIPSASVLASGPDPVECSSPSAVKGLELDGTFLIHPRPCLVSLSRSCKESFSLFHEVQNGFKLKPMSGYGEPHPNHSIFT